MANLPGSPLPGNICIKTWTCTPADKGQFKKSVLGQGVPVATPYYNIQFRIIIHLLLNYPNNNQNKYNDSYYYIQSEYYNTFLS